jgi:tetratricopeptide (TPR) repeat protein
MPDDPTRMTKHPGMQKIVDWLRKLHQVNVEQTVDAEHNENTTISQTTNVYPFLIPSLVLALALIAFGYWGYSKSQQSKYNTLPMASGKLNVVVAPFSDQTNGNCGASPDVGQLVASAFSSALASGKYDQTSTIQPAFRPSGEVPPLQGESDIELTRSAEHLARQINAQIVIYGRITCTEITQKPSVKIMFFVAPSGFSDAHELIGEFSFSSGALYGNLSSGQEFLGSNENLQQKINVMSLVVNSLGSYLGENYAQAFTTISAALESPLWESEGGKEVIYVLAGNIETRYADQLNVAGQEEQALKEIEQAKSFYRLANELSRSRGLGDYGRAYIGLAGVEHFYAIYKSRTSCKLEDIDLEKFSPEKENLKSAGKAENSPITADIPEKIAFDTAQIDLTLYSIDPSSVRLEDIAENYDFVISAYTDTENPNLRVQEMAAHSYAGLGFIHWYDGNVQGVQDNFRLAITTTESPALQAGYLKSFGNYYLLNEDYEKALVYYKEALGIIKEFKIQPATCDSDINELITRAEKGAQP